MEVDEIVAAVRDGNFSTRDLVRISCALARRGSNTTSVLGQYGEELVAAAYGGRISSFDQKGYDVVTADGEELQVKTYTTGNRLGVIRVIRLRCGDRRDQPRHGDRGVNPAVQGHRPLRGVLCQVEGQVPSRQ